MEPEGSLPHLQVPSTISILSQINPVHASLSHILKIRLYIIRYSRLAGHKIRDFMKIIIIIIIMYE